MKGLSGVVDGDHYFDTIAEDLTFELAKRLGYTALDIYELDGDTLRICRTWKEKPSARSSRPPKGRGWYSQCGSERRSNGESRSRRLTEPSAAAGRRGMRFLDFVAQRARRLLSSVVRRMNRTALNRKQKEIEPWSAS